MTRMFRGWFGICVWLTVVFVSMFLIGGNCMAEKYPTFQVWGGSVFTYGNITASEVTTRSTGLDGTYAFGSWVEYGVFANGYVQGLASGAASSGGVSWGGTDDSFCKRLAPLSFANYATNSSGLDFRFCNSNGMGSLTGAFGYNFPKFNIASSLSMLEKDPEANVQIWSASEPVMIPSDKYGGGDGAVTGRVVVATYGDVTITDDLIYDRVGEGEDEKRYYSLEEVPKLFIYANNVNIQCNVKRVDAVIFASGMVDTCSNGPKKGDNTPDYEAVDYSTPLTINGAVIAEKVVFKRTYGAVNLEKLNSADDRTDGEVRSKCQDKVRECASIPAEVVNYDTSILVTGKEANTSTQQVNLVTMYQRELPPRY